MDTQIKWGMKLLAWSLTSLAVSQRPVSSGACQPERFTLGLNASSGGRASLLSVHTCASRGNSRVTGKSYRAEVGFEPMTCGV